MGKKITCYFVSFLLGSSGHFAGSIAPLFARDTRKGVMDGIAGNFFACNINEKPDSIKETADALISTGLAELGYVYVNIDDCWSSTKRDSKGQLIPDPKTFSIGN
ncbi:hypothetical protein NC653_041304 [Populus alba x Populus x berolinensis]|uniref:Alpha-galactosidase n=1 Tax=Populus alba x Populus x berolinensis TaxID=444605 RepID=A0AAD6PPR9_9ROSI|nr:hypothetical protein NC653_041304 [Populus alba x Populus x berolinensis]